MSGPALVTGGAGFIGAHVARHLLDAGREVVVLDDLSGGFTENVPERARFVEGSILDVPLIERLFSEYRFSHVFHLAAYAAEGLSHFIRRFNYENNLIGSVNLLNASVLSGSVERYVFTSSIAVYGAGQVPMTEDLTPRPEDPYGIAKLAVEQDLMAAHDMFGLEWTVFRPHNVYGELQNIADRYRNVVGIFMNQILLGKPLSVFGDGKQERAFTHIDDVAPIIARSVEIPESSCEIFNVGADKPHSVNRLAEVVADSLGVEPDIDYLPARNEVQIAYSDHSKAERLLGYHPQVELEEGIGRMAAWVREVGARKSKPFGSVEIIENLPPSWRADLESESQ
ncbi:MAG: NAD-dependent epimerase/dehydratase family protein [Planctomycetota bacterium]|nr:NAD-dependent epimerase/dehydratase family protein [Planctomycetota bacterium]